LWRSAKSISFTSSPFQRWGVVRAQGAGESFAQSAARRRLAREPLDERGGKRGAGIEQPTDLLVQRPEVGEQGGRGHVGPVDPASQRGGCGRVVRCRAGGRSRPWYRSGDGRWRPLVLERARVLVLDAPIGRWLAAQRRLDVFESLLRLLDRAGDEFGERRCGPAALGI